MALIQASIEQLRVGHYIHLPTGWTSHPFMFNAFKIKDQQQLDIIRHLDLTLLMVDPDKSDLPVEPLLRAEPVPSLEMSDTGDTAPLLRAPPSTKRRSGAPFASRTRRSVNPCQIFATPLAPSTSNRTKAWPILRR